MPFSNYVAYLELLLASCNSRCNSAMQSLSSRDLNYSRLKNYRNCQTIQSVTNGQCHTATKEITAILQVEVLTSQLGKLVRSIFGSGLRLWFTVCPLPLLSFQRTVAWASNGLGTKHIAYGQSHATVDFTWQVVATELAKRPGAGARTGGEPRGRRC